MERTVVEKQGMARWVVVAAASAGMAAAYGGISTISVLIEPFRAEFGWAKADISMAYLLVSAGAALGGLGAGRLTDRLPTGPIAVAGVIFIALGLAVIAHLSTVEAVQLVYLGIGLLGFSCLYAPLLATTTLWFRRGGHGVALGIVTAGGALGQAVVPAVFQALDAAYGWRNATTILAAAFLVLFVPIMMLIRKPPSAPVGAGPSAAPVRASWPLHPALGVALIGVAALFCCGTMGVPSVHLVSYAITAGQSPSVAATIIGVTMIAGCVGRIGAGFVVDRIGALAAYAIMSAVQTAGAYAFVQTTSPWALGAIGIVYGLGFGGVMTGMVCAVRDAAPPRAIGLAMAVVALLAWAGMGAGGYQGGLCFDLTGSYELSFTLAAAAGLANLATIALLAALIRLRRPQPSWARAVSTSSKGSPVIRLAVRTASRSGAA
jgi:MFS family permease